MHCPVATAAHGDNLYLDRTVSSVRHNPVTICLLLAVLPFGPLTMLLVFVIMPALANSIALYHCKVRRKKDGMHIGGFAAEYEGHASAKVMCDILKSDLQVGLPKDAAKQSDVATVRST